MSALRKEELLGNAHVPKPRAYEYNDCSNNWYWIFFKPSFSLVVRLPVDGSSLGAGAGDEKL